MKHPFTTNACLRQTFRPPMNKTGGCRSASKVVHLVESTVIKARRQRRACSANRRLDRFSPVSPTNVRHAACAASNTNLVCVKKYSERRQLLLGPSEKRWPTSSTHFIPFLCDIYKRLCIPYRNPCKLAVPASSRGSQSPAGPLLHLNMTGLSRDLHQWGVLKGYGLASVMINRNCGGDSDGEARYGLVHWYTSTLLRCCRH